MSLPTKDRRLDPDPPGYIHAAPGRKSLPIDWDVIEREYIGGVVEPDAKGQYSRKWPTLRELEKRYGICLSTLNYQSTRRNWVGRRGDFQRSIQREFDSAVAKARGNIIREAGEMLDTYISRFGKAIKADQIPRGSVADLERALKLRQWVTAEARAAVTHGGVNMDDLRERHAEVRRFVSDLDPAQCGIIVGRTEREAAAETGPGRAGTGPAGDEGGRIAPPDLGAELQDSEAWIAAAALADRAIASRKKKGQGEGQRAKRSQRAA